jgi:hypothetical protein
MTKPIVTPVKASVSEPIAKPSVQEWLIPNDPSRNSSMTAENASVDSPSPPSDAPTSSMENFIHPTPKTPVSKPESSSVSSKPVNQMEFDTRPQVLEILEQRDPPRRSNAPSSILILVEGQQNPYWIPLDTLKRDYRGATNALWNFRNAAFSQGKRDVSP